MFQNVGIDWNAFSFKFSGKEEVAFQQLAYLLFCAEHELPWGIFTYYNQTGIESEPVSHQGEIVGFQAKYYAPATQLSSKVSDLKKMILDSKQKNPQLSKILIYTNKELSESTKKEQKKPKYQLVIEECGRTNGVAIEWRVKSHFEASLFSGLIPPYVRDYFFNSDRGIMEFFRQVQRHTDDIIENISNEIHHNGKRISIDLTSLKIEEFIDSKHSCLIIHGESGTGKSGLIKALVLSQMNPDGVQRYPIFVFRATDFGYGTLAEFMRKFGDCDFDDFFLAFNNYQKRVVVIDAAEKVFLNENNILKNFIAKIINKGWKVVVTIRSSYREYFINYILKADPREELRIDSISSNELTKQLKKIGISPPTDRKLARLLCNLFYLNLYIETYVEPNIRETKSEFFKKIWDLRIKGEPYSTDSNASAREQFVVTMFKTILDSNSYYYTPCESELATKLADELKEAAVIAYDNAFAGYYFTHDVFEELVGRYLLKQAYDKTSSIVEFYSSLSISLPMRKHYRNWLLENLDDFLSRIPSIFSFMEIDKIWKDETLIALMTYSGDQESLEMTRSVLSQDDFFLLRRAVFLLNTACRILSKKQYLSNMFLESGNRMAYRFTEPSGAGWGFIISYIAENVEKIDWSEKFLHPVVEMLTTWVNNYTHGDITRLAGGIALFLYDKERKAKYSIRDRDFPQKLFNIIASAAHEIKQEIISIVNTVIDAEHIDRRILHIDFCEYLLSDVLHASTVCEALPDKMIALCNRLWQKELPQKDYPYYYYDEMDLGGEGAFGISTWLHGKYYPTSAYQTPILSLLRNSCDESLEFIIGFLNNAVHSLNLFQIKKEYGELPHIDIIARDDIHIKQFCSSNLWCLYRGIGTGPELLECILMALEKWLLEYINHTDERNANDLCKYLIEKTNNVCITAVVISLVIAYPDKLFDTAAQLIIIKEVYRFDIERFTRESSTNWLRGFPGDKLHNNERVESNKLEFRQRTFEQTLINYQIKYRNGSKEDKKKLRRLYQQLDKLANLISPENTTARFALNRMDLRKYHPDPNSEFTGADGKTYMALVADEDPDLIKIREQKNRENDQLWKYTNVSLWVRARFEDRTDDYLKYSAYEADPCMALHEFKLIIQDAETEKELDLLAQYTPIFGAAVLLRDFVALLDEDQIDFCCSLLIDALPMTFALQHKHEITDGTLPILSLMPYLLSRVDSDSDDYVALICSYALALLTDFSDDRKICSLFGKTMHKSHPIAASTILSLSVSLIPDFKSWLRTRREENETMEHFVILYEDKIEGIVEGKKKIETSDFTALDVNELMQTSLTLDTHNEEHYKLLLRIADPLFQRLFNKSDYSNQDDKVDFSLAYAFIGWLADWIYLSSKEKAKELINVIMAEANGDSSNISHLLSQFLSKHDQVKDNEKFWFIWNTLHPHVTALCEARKVQVIKLNRYSLSKLNDIISTYCLAWPWWGKQQKEWIGLQYEHLDFFNIIAKEIGYMPATLYSIAQVLCTIGSKYIIEGIFWLAIIIEENAHLATSELLINTIYNLEDALIRLVNEFEKDVRQKASLRKNVLIILNYLVERGSTVGFLIREELF